MTVQVFFGLHILSLVHCWMKLRFCVLLLLLVLVTDVIHVVSSRKAKRRRRVNCDRWANRRKPACRRKASAKPTSSPVVLLGGIDIQLVFLEGVTSKIAKVVTRSRARWSKAIKKTNGAFPINVSGVNVCNGAYKFPVDFPAIAPNTIVVMVKVKKLDNIGGTLAQAGPCILESRSLTPKVGMVEIDSSDVAWLLRFGRLEQVVTHEMGHVFGLGTLWQPFNLVRRRNSNYMGKVGNMESEASGFSSPAKVDQLQEFGGHWQEETYGDELMTSFLSGTDQPLSRMTLGSLQDMGYTVDMSQADAFVMTKVKRRHLRGTQAIPDQYGNDIMSTDMIQYLDGEHAG